MGDLLTLIYGAVGASGVLTGVWFTPWAKRRRDRQRRQDEFQVDWFGADARPGVERVPGVMERLAVLDKRTATPLLNGRGERALDRLEHLDVAVRRLDSRTARHGRELTTIRRSLAIPAQRTPTDHKEATSCE